MNFGGSSSEQSSSSKTKFPLKFLQEATKYFGPSPTYNPQYVGFSPDKIQAMGKNMLESQTATLSDQRAQQEKTMNEELSNSGLLTSPMQYMSGGPKDVMNTAYAKQIEQASRDAELAKLGMTQEEAARNTGFNVDTAKTLLSKYLDQLSLAASAGRESQSSGNASSFNFGIGWK